MDFDFLFNLYYPILCHLLDSGTQPNPKWTHLTISPKLDILLMFEIMCYQTKIKLYREKLHKFFMNNQKTIKNEKFLHYIRCKTFIIQLGVV